MALEFLKIILLSLLPVSELRGAIPYGIAFSKINPITVFLIAAASNAMAIPITYLFLNYAHRHFMKLRIYRSLFLRYVERAKQKAHGKVSKYGYLGLMIFVAIPLPATGAYTGTLVAWLFSLDRKKATIFIILGILIAGAIMTTISLTGAGAGTLIRRALFN